jgi:hypothetical protein
MRQPKAAVAPPSPEKIVLFFTLQESQKVWEFEKCAPVSNHFHAEMISEKGMEILYIVETTVPRRGKQTSEEKRGYC